jgi:hypothetical protein
MGQLRDALNTCPLIFVVWPLPAAPLKPVQASQACHFPLWELLDQNVGLLGCCLVNLGGAVFAHSACAHPQP